MATTSRPSGEIAGSEKSVPAGLSSVLRSEVARSMATSSARRPPAGAGARPPGPAPGASRARPTPGGGPGPPGSVRRQAERLLVQGPPAIRGQVAELGLARVLADTASPGRVLGGPRRHLAGHQPQAVRSEVVVPVPDHASLVQYRGHASVRAGLPAGGILIGPAGAGKGRDGKQVAPRDPRRGQRADAAWRSSDPAGLAAGRRQQPQGALRGLGGPVLLRPGLGSLGDEEERAVGQELGARLAFR